MSINKFMSHQVKQNGESLPFYPYQEETKQQSTPSIPMPMPQTQQTCGFNSMFNYQSHLPIPPESGNRRLLVDKFNKIANKTQILKCLLVDPSFDDNKYKEAKRQFHEILLISRSLEYDNYDEYQKARIEHELKKQKLIQSQKKDVID